MICISVNLLTFFSDGSYTVKWSRSLIKKKKKRKESISILVECGTVCLCVCACVYGGGGCRGWGICEHEVRLELLFS